MPREHGHAMARLCAAHTTSQARLCEQIAEFSIHRPAQRQQLDHRLADFDYCLIVQKTQKADAQQCFERNKHNLDEQHASWRKFRICDSHVEQREALARKLREDKRCRFTKALHALMSTRSDTRMDKPSFAIFPVCYDTQRRTTDEILSFFNDDPCSASTPQAQGLSCCRL
jgi:hypothetical protein